MQATVTRLMFGAAASLLLGGVGLANAAPHCQPISGTVMTNLGVVDNSTTLGVVDGDLKGAVAATIKSVTPGPNGTTIFMSSIISSHNPATRSRLKSPPPPLLRSHPGFTPSSIIRCISPVAPAGLPAHWATSTTSALPSSIPTGLPAERYSVTPGKSALPSPTNVLVTGHTRLALVRPSQRFKSGGQANE